MKIKQDAVARLDYLLDRLIEKGAQDVMKVLAGRVTPAQFAVLRVLKARGPLSVSQLADRLQITPSAVTSIVDRMADIGLLGRIRDQNDRRVVWIEATEEGKTLATELEGVKRQMLGMYLDSLTYYEMTSLADILERIMSEGEIAHEPR